MAKWGNTLKTSQHKVSEAVNIQGWKEGLYPFFPPFERDLTYGGHELELTVFPRCESPAEGEGGYYENLLDRKLAARKACVFRGNMERWKKTKEKMKGGKNPWTEHFALKIVSKLS